eukprot:1147765-Pelagomonas_calceolata.AAC.4
MSFCKSGCLHAVLDKSNRKQQSLDTSILANNRTETCPLPVTPWGRPLCSALLEFCRALSDVLDVNRVLDRKAGSPRTARTPHALEMQAKPEMFLGSRITDL